MSTEAVINKAGSYRCEDCGCSIYCGDDGNIDGPEVCKGLPREPEPPLVEVVLRDRNAYGAQDRAAREARG